jgi:hypothetical protein
MAGADFAKPGELDLDIQFEERQNQDIWPSGALMKSDVKLG